MTRSVPLILASQSPRRAQLLRDAGIEFEQRSPPFEDPDQPPGHLDSDEAEGYAATLALQKAKSLAEVIDKACFILAADTICVDDAGSLVGKPTNQAHARAMLDSFTQTQHRVITGVALLKAGPEHQSQAYSVTAWASGVDQTLVGVKSFSDTATVHFGRVNDERLDAYVATDDWRGKAGGYNLFDRQNAGWPIKVVGDPTTVVGLPMARLIPILQTAISIG